MSQHQERFNRVHFGVPSLKPEIRMKTDWSIGGTLISQFSFGLSNAVENCGRLGSNLDFHFEPVEPENFQS